MLGILGGSFDPVHNGHLAIARAAYIELNLTEVSFIPCGQHAFGKAIKASNTDRLAMLAAAIDHETFFTIDNQEIDRNGPSYTIDTLKNIRSAIGKQESIGWIIGMDAFLSLPQWKDWNHLLNYCHLIVVARKTDTTQLSDELQTYLSQHQATNKSELHTSPAGKIYLLKLPTIDISGTKIRELIHAGKMPHDMLPEKVAEYIKAHELYK